MVVVRIAVRALLKLTGSSFNFIWRLKGMKTDGRS